MHTCLMNAKTHVVLHAAIIEADELYCDSHAAGSASISIVAVVLAVIHPPPSAEVGAQAAKGLLAALDAERRP